MDTKFFATAADFRAWLSNHHASADELLVGFWKKHSGKPSVDWPEARDQALCFGWIDGVRKSMGSESYTIRFTPRRKGSIWSQVNLRHMKRLLAARRVRAAGRAAYEQRDETRTKRYSFENEPQPFTAEETKRFRASRKAWAFFESLPPSQRRGFTWWVVSARKDETRRRRLEGA